jgi:hypothetical protein
MDESRLTKLGLLPVLLVFAAKTAHAQPPTGAPPSSAQPSSPATPPAVAPPASGAGPASPPATPAQPSVGPALPPPPAPAAALAPAPPAQGAQGAPSAGADAGSAPGLVPAVVIGKWRTQVYGFAEVDVSHDSTQAFPDLGGWLSTAIPKNYNYAGSRDRVQASARNSRFGFVVNPPDFAGIHPTLTLEGDFMGNQPSDASESAILTNPTFRLRIAAMQLEDDYVNVLAGQAWELFGFQPFFFPATDFLLPLPGGVLKRDIQVQLTHTFKTQPIDVQIGVSGNRPPQRDSAMPDLQGALRVFINDWKGLHTPGTSGQRQVGTSLDPLALAVSGATRRFRVGDYEPTPAGTSPDWRFSNSATGWALAADAFIPIIPAASADDRGNALTLTGEFTTGTGYADLLGGLVANGGGPAAPVSTYPMIPGSPDPYVANIQPGLLTYDNAGNLHTIDWQTFVIGGQYYLPILSGNVFVSGNYAEARSGNIANWADPGQQAFIFTKTQYYDANLFWDASRSVRVVASFQNYKQTFADGETASNQRIELSGFFWF